MNNTTTIMTYTKMFPYRITQNTIHKTATMSNTKKIWERKTGHMNLMNMTVRHTKKTLNMIHMNTMATYWTR